MEDKNLLFGGATLRSPTQTLPAAEVRPRAQGGGGSARRPQAVWWFDERVHCSRTAWRSEGWCCASHSRGKRG